MILVLVLAGLACGLPNPLGGLLGGSDETAVSKLWGDVPRMDGLEPSELDSIPLPIKLVLNTVLANLGRLNPEGVDQSTGTIDWIGFTTTQPVDDLTGFYTYDRMAEKGWDVAEGSPCLSGDVEGVPLPGTMCVFSRDNDQTLLAIFAVPEAEGSSSLNIFFLRLGKNSK